MNAFYGLAGADADRDMTIVLNTANPVVAAFTGLSDEKKDFVANQIYYLAMLSYKKLAPEEMEAFSDNSVQLQKTNIGKPTGERGGGALCPPAVCIGERSANRRKVRVYFADLLA